MNFMLRKRLQISSILYRLIIFQQFIWSIQTLRIENIRFVTEQSNSNQLINNLLRTVNQLNQSTIRFSNESIRRSNQIAKFEKSNFIILNHELNDKESSSTGTRSNQANLFSANETNPSAIKLNESKRLVELNKPTKLIRINDDHQKSIFENQSRKARDLNETNKSNESAFEEDELYEIPNYLIVILTICYAAISFLAIISNLMILYIVVKSKKMQNPTNYLLANLSASDFLIGSFAIPFQFEAALLQRWILPYFFCSMCPFIQQTSLNCSVLTLTALSLDRFRAVLYPLKTKTSRLKSKLIILIIWAVSIAFALPTYIGYEIEFTFNKETGLKDQAFCNIIGFSQDIWRLYTYSLFILQYFLPLCVILYAYLRIGLNLLFASNSGITNSSSNRSDLSRMMKNKKRISFNQFSTLPVFFALFWLPFQVYLLLSEIYPSINTYKYINLVFFSSHLLAMSNSICQPFILFFYSEKWSIEIYRLYGNFICYSLCEKCLPRTIQRARFNQTGTTNFSSTNNNIALNCTTNNTCYSTNNLSNTPNSNSKLESDYLAICNVADANANECVDRLNKLNAGCLNKKSTCFMNSSPNSPLNSTLNSSISSCLHHDNSNKNRNKIENNSQSNSQNNLQDNLQDSLQASYYVDNNLNPVSLENVLNTDCSIQNRTSSNQMNNLHNRLSNRTSSHINLENKNQITSILYFVRIIYSFIQLLRPYLTSRSIIDQQLIKYFTIQSNREFK